MRNKTVAQSIHMGTAVSNILDVAFTHGTDSRGWYFTEYSNLRTMAESHRLAHHTVCGIFAALSPQMSWANNVYCATSFLRCALTLDVATIRNFDTAKRKQLGLTQSGDNIIKALRIFHGAHPLDVLGGEKVRSFYANLVNPSENKEVTIDRHALNIAQNGIYAKTSGDITADPKHYDMYAQAYKIAGSVLGMYGHEIQAATWTYVAMGTPVLWDFTR